MCSSDLEDMHRRIYGAAPLRRFRLLARALDTLEVDAAHGVAWMTVPSEIDGVEPSTDDVEGLVDYPRAVEGVEVGLLFRRSATGLTE